MLAYSLMAENSKNMITSSIKNYGKQLLIYIKGKVNSTEDAEDILQEVWFQLSNLTNIEELQSISGWLYQVARNKVIDLYRKKKTVSLEKYTYENEEGEMSIKDILLIDTNGNVELEMFKDMFWNELMKALDELPANQKEVFILNEIEEMTLQEIANNNNENLKTIISRKGYAVKYLRKKLNFLYQDLNT
jgi:RNA polymerase sigma factor (sigma-70 family)